MGMLGISLAAVYKLNDLTDLPAHLRGERAEGQGHRGLAGKKVEHLTNGV